MLIGQASLFFREASFLRDGAMMLFQEASFLSLQATILGSDNNFPLSTSIDPI